ncbi:MAG: DUF1211 domain-containing protein, partial [Chitinophagaceae bacterium]|nr:DUF1211 domain-containing protein [Chitinophagaceae bacterium]
MEAINHSPEKHPKQEFQVERLAFFSDAVFAIAITLLVIEFKVPHVTKESSYAEVWHEVVAMKFKFLALVLSFFLIANYWMQHHFLFKHIHNYNKKVIKMNIFVLLPIIFFPFTTAFFYESIINEQVVVIPFRIFLLNNVLAGSTTFALYWLVTKKHPELSYKIEPKESKAFEVTMFFAIISFFIVFLLSFISFEISLLGMLPLLAVQLYKKF